MCNKSHSLSHWLHQHLWDMRDSSPHMPVFTSAMVPPSVLTQVSTHSGWLSPHCLLCIGFQSTKYSKWLAKNSYTLLTLKYGVNLLNAPCSKRIASKFVRSFKCDLECVKAFPIALIWKAGLFPMRSFGW